MLVVGDLHGPAMLDTEMPGQFEIETAPVRPGPAIVDEAGEGLLPAIEIDGGYALASLHAGNSDAHGQGGLA